MGAARCWQARRSQVWVIREVYRIPLNTAVKGSEARLCGTDRLEAYVRLQNQGDVPVSEPNGKNRVRQDLRPQPHPFVCRRWETSNSSDDDSGFAKCQEIG